MNEPHVIIIRPTEKLSSWGRSYVALNEKNRVIGSHYCSSDDYAKWDLGDRCKVKYDNLFPQGWTTVFDSKIRVIRKPKEK